MVRSTLLWALAIACLLGHVVALSDEDGSLVSNLGDNEWHFPNYKDGSYRTDLGHKAGAFLQEKQREAEDPAPGSVQLKDPKVFGPATASISTSDSFPAVDLGASSGMELTSTGSGAVAPAPAPDAASSAAAAGTGGGTSVGEEKTLGDGSLAPPESGVGSAAASGAATDGTAGEGASEGGPSVMEAAPLGLQGRDASPSHSDDTPAKCETENACNTKIVKSLSFGSRSYVHPVTIVNKKTGTAQQEEQSEEKRTPLDVALEQKDAEDPEIKKLKDAMQATVDTMKGDKDWINNISAMIHKYRQSIAQRKKVIRKQGKKYFDLKSKIKERQHLNFRQLMKERLDTVSKALHMVNKESEKLKGTHTDLNAVRNQLSAQIGNFQQQILALRSSEYFDRQ